MPILTQFAVPANQADLTGSDQQRLADQWSGNLNRWTETAILGDPWGSLNDQHRGYYFNPLTTDLVGQSVSKPIAWTAFPNRILVNFANATFLQQMGYAEGVHDDGTFGPPPAVNGAPYRPGGPRGWQDEYCEWIAVRDTNGKVVSIDYTCENPEYWFSLWRVDPSRVLALYRQIVSPSVQLAELYLLDSNNDPVIDRATGKPAYNPLNQWNNQPSKGAVTGAVHLISPPNTLGAEIYLAAAATLLRVQNGQPVTNPDQLIACSQYGTPGRNSDPHIGSEVNNVIIGGGLVASLQDPVGLYIQMPDFSGYSLPADPNLPANADASECWHILRGHARGPRDNVDFILHVRFEIPQRWKDAGVAFTVGDIQINGNNIEYGAQLTQTFQIALRGLAISTTLPAETPQPCRANNPQPLPSSQAVQDMNLFLAGTTSAAVTLIEQGSSVPNIAIFTANTRAQTHIAFTGAAGVSVDVTQFQDMGAQGQLFTVTITAAANAPLGDRALLLTNINGTAGSAAPGMLSIVPPGSLAAHAAPVAANPLAEAMAKRRLHGARHV